MTPAEPFRSDAGPCFAPRISMMMTLIKTTTLTACLLISLAPAAKAQMQPAIMPTFINCGDPSKANQYWITDSHAKMVEALEKVTAALQNETDPVAHKILGDAFADIFKGTIDSSEWLTLKAMILDVAPHIINESVYQCADKQSVLFCSISGAPAFTPTSRDKNILCAGSLKRVDLLPGVLLHESMHRWGGKNIDYIGELYCADWESKKPDTARPVRTPDAYMKFIYQVAKDGQPFGWPPCYAKELVGKTTI